MWVIVPFPCWVSSLKLSIYSHISRFLKVFSVLLQQESSRIWKASSEKTNMKQEIIQHINQLVKAEEPFLFVINYQGDKAYIKKLSEIEPHECLYDFDGKTNTKDLSPNGLPSKISWKAMAPSFSDYTKSFDIVKRTSWQAIAISRILLARFPSSVIYRLKMFSFIPRGNTSCSWVMVKTALANSYVSRQRPS